MSASERFAESVAEAVSRYVDDLLAEQMQAPRSKALGFAVAAGLPPRWAYSVDETARYTGVPASVLMDEMGAGRLHATKAQGRRRGAVLTVGEVDRWMEASTL